MQTNNHQFITGQGSAQTNDPLKKNQNGYVSAFNTITVKDVEDLVKQPQRQPKALAQWAIFSPLQSRTFEEQRKNGSFGMLWADLDEHSGDITIDVVKDVLSAILQNPTAKYYIHHTSSWLPESTCYRVFIPLSTAISGEDFVICQEVLNNKLASVGLVPDRASERAGQLCYLPNIPLDKDASLYRYYIIEGEELDPLFAFSDEILGIKERKKIESEEHNERMKSALAKAVERASTGVESPIDIYNSTQSIEDLFIKYGYIKSGKNWRSPNQESKSYATTIKDLKWVSQSGSDAAAGLGATARNGSCYGDAFDLYKFYECGNNHTNALKELGLLLGTTKANQVKYAKNQENQRITTMFENMVPAQPSVVTENDLLPFEKLPICQCEITGDQYQDALSILNYVFTGRLKKSEEKLYWWDGRMFGAIDDSLARKHIGRALFGGVGKITDSRIKGTFNIMRDATDEMGTPDPVSSHVFFRNGVFDINTGTMENHAPKFNNTRVLAVGYEPESVPTRFLEWLKDIFESDLERIKLLQEIMGWALTRDTLGLQKGVLFIGVSRAGKGVLIKIMQRLLGDASCCFSLNSLDDHKVLSSMIGKNIAFDAEAAEPDRGNVKAIQTTFKNITSNDPIKITKLYTQKPWNGELSCKLLAAANTMPRMFDDSDATAKRWVPLVFDKSFDGREDTELLNSLLAELPAIASWCAEGLQRLNRNRRFTMPETTRNELANIVEQGSPIKRFIEECCRFGTGETYRATRKEVNRIYKDWCIKNDETYNPRGIDSITDSVRGNGVQLKKSLRVGALTTTGFDGMQVIDPYFTDESLNVYRLAKGRA